MGYKNKSKQSDYQNKWLQDRRREWVEKNGPCRICKSHTELRVVKNHESVQSVKVFSYSEEARNEILKKCMVLCARHTQEHYAKIMQSKYKAKPTHLAPILSAHHVWAIRGRLLGRESVREIAREYKITHHQILAIQRGKSWSYLKGGRRKVWGIEKTEDLE